MNSRQLFNHFKDLDQKLKAKSSSNSQLNLTTAENTVKIAEVEATLAELHKTVAYLSSTLIADAKKGEDSEVRKTFRKGESSDKGAMKKNRYPETWCRTDLWIPEELNDSWERTKFQFIEKYYYWGLYPNTDPNNAFSLHVLGLSNRDKILAKAFLDAAKDAQIKMMAPELVSLQPPTIPGTDLPDRAQVTAEVDQWAAKRKISRIRNKEEYSKLEKMIFNRYRLRTDEQLEEERRQEKKRKEEKKT